MSSQFLPENILKMAADMAHVLDEEPNNDLQGKNYKYTECVISNNQLQFHNQYIFFSESFQIFTSTGQQFDVATFGYTIRD